MVDVVDSIFNGFNWQQVSTDVNITQLAHQLCTVERIHLQIQKGCMQCFYSVLLFFFVIHVFKTPKACFSLMQVKNNSYDFWSVCLPLV